MTAARRKTRPEEIRGLKYMDQYCSLILPPVFSPIVDGLRGLQRAPA